MKINEIKELYSKYILQTYIQQDTCLVKGDGVWVEDTEGNKYLDFFPGWAVSGVGHRHPRVVANIKEQVDKILHVSNNFYNELQPLLAEKIIKHSFPGKVFFANSGAEANEAAIKLARKYGNPSRYEIITMEKSFHGRTLATMTATGQDKVKKGFSPLPEGFKHIPFNDIEAFKKAITDKTIAVILEPIQGEGGINVADQVYMKELGMICKEKDILLILDEVQTCMGRTGEMFAFKHYDIQPDAITLAKSLGGGLPIGALVVNEKHEGILNAGSHASTFGGSPIVCSAALGVFEAIEEEDLLANCITMGEYLREKIQELMDKYGILSGIKGKGLMLGVETELEDASVITTNCVKQGLLINCTQKNILRIMPPINITREDIDLAVEKIAAVLEKL